MIIFSTKLYVKETMTEDLFIEMAIKWVSGGPNYTFGDIVYDGTEEYSIENDTGTQKFTIYKYENIVVIHLVNKDRKIIWTNDFILRKINGKRIVAVHLYNDAEDMSVKLPTEFNRPKLLKDMILNGYGEIDNYLETNDKPYIINDKNIDIVKELILGNSKYLMPVVYVTSTKGMSTYKLDCNELAKDLAGVAHVIVEEDCKISKALKGITEYKNPYDGAVQIFYPNVGTQRILPKFYADSNEFRKEVAYSVYRRLILGKIDDAFSVTKIRYNNLFIKNKKSEELEQVFNEVLKENDSIIETKNNLIEELEEEINKLKSKIIAYEQIDIKRKSCMEQHIISNSSEKELYLGELKDIILKVIKKEALLMNEDPNQKASRKYHVINDLMKMNRESEKQDDIVKKIKNMLNGDGSFNKSQKRQVMELGFEIEDGKHYKLKYKGDDRYSLTLAKTPSDYKANINAVQEIIRVLFKY